MTSRRQTSKIRSPAVPSARNRAGILKTGYAVLLNQVKKTLIEGQMHIEARRVRSCWATGRLVNAHIRKYAGRDVQYGEEIILCLSRDLHVKFLYTCAAYVEKVVDGDTVKIRLDLGFRIRAWQTLRLRDLDCPESGTPEGGEAKKFVRSRLKESRFIIVRSSRSDKYDRYLADVFIPQDGEPGPATDIYLNNLLLKTGRARRV